MTREFLSTTIIRRHETCDTSSTAGLATPTVFAFFFFRLFSGPSRIENGSTNNALGILFLCVLLVENYSAADFNGL